MLCRQWSVVAREWRGEMGGGEALRIKKAYKKFLLAFEQHLSQGTIVEIRKVLWLHVNHMQSEMQQ